ncbi:MAG: tripartite tricarboxylate transporter substrate binding protein [Betaproteobacteria bacterium]|nr:tripartite tricarboxylate transporter substrate binding protein [Betaproteobacteria bacterium]
MSRLLNGCALGIATMLCAAACIAQGYPVRPIRIIVPFAPGAPDTLARILGQQLGTQMGQSVIVENRPGANGLIGADLVAKAPADGYTILLTSTSYAINPSTYKKLPFDPVKDLAPVINTCGIEALILAVNPAVPVHTLEGLMALAKRPGSNLSFGSPGVGNSLHLAGEMLNAIAGLQMVHVPYKGAGPAIAALVGGEIQVMFVTPPLSLPHIRAGKLRPLAYTTTTRASFLPDVPTMAEAGLPAYQLDGGWFIVFAPSGMPAEIMHRLQKEFATALTLPAIRERLATLGLHPIGTTGDELKRFVDAQIKKYAELVKLAGIQPE